MSRSDSLRSVSREALVAAFVVTLYVAYAALATPRLTSTVHSDVDVTGWSGVIASHVGAGQRLYTDFDVAMPPGGVAAMVGLQRVMGRFRLIDELTLIAGLRIVLAALAGLAVAPLVSRRATLLTAIAALALSLGWTPLSAQLWLASVCAWASFAAAGRALLREGVARRRALMLCGSLSGLTLAFDQATALGVLIGWPAALAVAVAARRVVLRPALGGFGLWLVGVVLGVTASLGFTRALGGTPSGFVRDVIVDGAVLAGRGVDVASDLVRIVLRAPAYPSSMMFSAILAWVALRALRPAQARALAPIGTSGRDAAWLVLGAVATLGGAAVLLARPGSQLPLVVATYAHRIEQLPGLGAALGAAYLVARPVAAVGDDAPFPRERLAGEAVLVAAFVAAVVQASGFHIGEAALSLDALALSPLVPIGLGALFAAVERAGLPAFGPVLALVALGNVYGPTLGRALVATTVVSDGYWAGLRVGVRGTELLDAAAHARRLAGPDGRVLVVPEDPALSALIGRSRPKLRGGLVFVDQYPRRLVQADLSTLWQDPPALVVVHPADDADWHKLFGARGETSGATLLCERVLRDLLPQAYARDPRSFRSSYVRSQGRIELWVRR